MDALRQDGHKVIACGPPDKYVDRLKAHCDVYIPLYSLNAKGKNPLWDLKLTREFRRVIKANSIDLAFTFTAKPNIFFAIAAKATKVRVIPTVNGLGNVFITPSCLSRLMLKLYRVAFKNCERVIFQNPDDLAFFLQLGIINQEQGAQTAGSGVDLVKFPHSPLKINAGSRRFLFSARLVREKGIYEFLEAAKIILSERDDVSFKVIGMVAKNPSSLNEEEIKGYADNGLITYTGHTDRMEEEIRGADVLVLPSYYREGVPRVLLEGLATGRPIITTDSIGCRETVEDGKNGILVSPKNGKELTEAIVCLADMSDEELVEMSIESRLLAERKFDEADVVRLYRESV
jgi:glycosyltransferase involved in cell wall biosynthesis